MLSDWGHDSTTVKNFNLVRNIPPEPSRGGFLYDPGARSFRLLKLARSTTTGSRETSQAPWWQRLPLTGTWSEPFLLDEQERREQLPGREPFIVPQAAAKSSFYNNPISRGNWSGLVDRFDWSGL
jgi:hypothetical protein